jgi:hypothetical protein
VSSTPADAHETSAKTNNSAKKILLFFISILSPFEILEDIHLKLIIIFGFQIE